MRRTCRSIKNDKATMKPNLKPNVCIILNQQREDNNTIELHLLVRAEQRKPSYVLCSDYKFYNTHDASRERTNRNEGSDPVGVTENIADRRRRNVIREEENRGQEGGVGAATAYVARVAVQPSAEVVLGHGSRTGGDCETRATDDWRWRNLLWR
jgi:hypothetical protein